VEGRQRVFAATDIELRPVELLEHLQAEGYTVEGHFRGDDEGWFEAELVVGGTEAVLQRFLATEVGIRSELNTWAAWVESTGDGPLQEALMQRLIATRQIFVLGEAGMGWGATLCRYLARRTEGIYQVDGRGFFQADGKLLLAEE
jgi:hypothetical protein